MLYAKASADIDQDQIVSCLSLLLSTGNDPNQTTSGSHWYISHTN